jgi:hypothetical protein
VKYGRTENQWNELASVGLAFLIERAHLGRPTSYTEFSAVLAQRTGLHGFDFERPDERAGMGHLLGLIVELNRPLTGLMISALVNYLNENEPGPGFYAFAQELGLLRRGASDPERFDFWTEQVTALQRFYA